MGASPSTGAAARRYAGTMAGFWSGLSGTLRGLDEIAATSARLDESAVDTLRGLQYRLHRASEALAGVEAPEGAHARHAALVDALVDARDATGEMVEAIELGGNEAALGLLFEWRGVLFGVRLARFRLNAPPAPAIASVPESQAGAAAATVLTLVGVGAFTMGAFVGLWPVWAAGLALVAASLLVYRN